jgi:hypothetical protein
MNHAGFQMLVPAATAIQTPVNAMQVIDSKADSHTGKEQDRTEAQEANKVSPHHSADLLNATTWLWG